MERIEDTRLIDAITATANARLALDRAREHERTCRREAGRARALAYNRQAATEAATRRASGSARPVGRPVVLDPDVLKDAQANRGFTREYFRKSRGLTYTQSKAYDDVVHFTSE